MKIKDCIPGTRVWYTPILGNKERAFQGTVREHPWQLGDGTWVTHLKDMEDAYGVYVGRPDKRHVHAAHVTAALTRVDDRARALEEERRPQ